MSITKKEETKKLQDEIEALKAALNKKDKEISELKDDIKTKEMEQKTKGYFVRREVVLRRAKNLFDNKRREIIEAIQDLSNVHVILFGDGDYYYPELKKGLLSLRYNNNGLMDVSVVTIALDDMSTDTIKSVVDNMYNKIIEALEKCKKNSDFADCPVNNYYFG